MQAICYGSYARDGKSRYIKLPEFPNASQTFRFLLIQKYLLNLFDYIRLINKYQNLKEYTHFGYMNFYLEHV